MGQSKESKWARMCASVKNGISGKVLFVFFHWAFLAAGWFFFKQKIIAHTGDIVDLTINEIALLLFTFLPVVVIFGHSLISEKIQAGVTKQESKDKAEIEKLKLEICKIKCERELIESKDRCSESRKEKQQSAPEK